MKKKILALTLCLVLFILPVMSSCSSDTLGTFDLMNYVGDDNASYDTTDNYEPEGNYHSGTDKYVVTQELVLAETDGGVELLAAAPESDMSQGADRVPADEDEYALYDKYIYRVYDIKTGELLVSKTVILDYFEEDATLVDLTVSSHYNADDYFIIRCTLANGSCNTELYSMDGTAVKVWHTEADDLNADDGIDGLISFYSDNHFVINNELYRIEDGEATLVKNIKNVMSLPVYENIEIYNNGQYLSYTDSDDGIDDGYYDNNSSNTIVVFDGNLNVTNYISLPQYERINSISMTVNFLNNNNALVTYIESIDAVNLTEDQDYDFVADGTAYNIDSYICDTTTGELSSIEDIPMYEFNIVPVGPLKKMADRAEMDYEINEIGDNIIMGYKIVDGKVEDKMTSAILSNDGTISAYVGELDGVSSSEISISAYINADVACVTLPYGTYLYNTKTYERIGELPDYDFDYTAKWIVCEDAIYNLDLELAYTIPKDYVIEYIGGEVVYLSHYVGAIDPAEEGEEGTPGYTTFYVYDGELKEVLKIEDGDYDTDIGFSDRYFYTAVPNYDTEAAVETVSSYTYKFYTADGDTVILELTAEYRHYIIITNYRYEDFTLIQERVENEETGDISYKYHTLTKADA